MSYEQALALVRLMLDRGVLRDVAIDNPAIPEEFRRPIREELDRESNVLLEPARILVADSRRGEWLRNVDRERWYYWPTLREYLLGRRGWQAAAVRSLDETTDRVLSQLPAPTLTEFDVRGLVLGFVQSGKTANYTALIAKAADVGYRLVIVLSGIDNGLRRQTQLRLKAELVGYADNRPSAVRLPPVGQRWHEFTREELDGDFRPGYTTPTALQGPQPVLLVVKKNGAVLRRLLQWLREAPMDVRRNIPTLLIDDEADQASVDTRGTYQTEDELPSQDYEPPSVINGLIRDLLGLFSRKTYVAYTATPFANILIPHDAFDPSLQNDLYPRDFIVDLPRPEGYFGAEHLFGRFDSATGQEILGLDVVRSVSDEDLQTLDAANVPASLEAAILDFVLAGAARAQRGQADAPATMLVHTSSRIADQTLLSRHIDSRFGELRDEWRYHRQHTIFQRLRERWESEFRPVTRSRYLDRDVPFEAIEPFIGPCFESVQVIEVNSATGLALDYEREPSLKAIAVGGNRLSRGLTLEGLTVSFFVRRTVMYDTLMQMGRWFGFRRGYDDLTRIYTTAELAGWFSDLALVEHDLREDIRVYEAQNLTPMQVGTRILQHPSMLVTSRLKQRFATTVTVAQSYAGKVLQTFKFPFNRPGDLQLLLDGNLAATREFIQDLGAFAEWRDGGPLWSGVPVANVLRFLEAYQLDDQVRSLSLPLVRAYVERQTELDELVEWTIAVRGRGTRDRRLGVAEWGIPDRQLFQMARSRRSADPNSLGVLTEPGDELLGLTDDERAQVAARQQAASIGVNPAARQIRSPRTGLLLLYPVSRYSGQDASGETRIPLYENPDGVHARDIVGMAISFPESERAQHVYGEYVVGTAGWRPME
jgi:hypothetical protein